jgi:hypothetical protein
MVTKDSNGKYDLVLDKHTLVVEKKECYDPDDETIDYEICLMADCACEQGENKKDHVRIVITTDDKFIADKFQCGRNVDIECTQTLMQQHALKAGVQ